MKTKPATSTPVERGVGNVFADLGIANPEQEQSS